MNSENLLIIFARHPELGKCKTRLAKTIGDQAALDIYTLLLAQTVKATQNLPVDKEVHYTDIIVSHDIWDTNVYNKRQQQGEDLGSRMLHAFKSGFKAGYKNVLIIGTDLHDLDQTDLELAYTKLKDHDYVIGPSQDGGYYLLGMNALNPDIFRNKHWSTPTVLKDTLNDIKNKTHFLLKERNDVDIYEDIQDIAMFEKFLPKELK